MKGLRQTLALNSTDTSNTAGRLPRLLYLGDLPIEGALAGAAALYRLLAEYPPGRLRMLLSNLAVGSGYIGAPSLPGILKDQFFLAHRRPMYTHVSGLYKWYVLARSGVIRADIGNIAREFGTEAVLTVSVGYSWRLAAALARHLRVPLYLVSHDDWRVNLDLPRPLQRSAERWFAEVYRQAAARFVVSPYMAAEFERRYGAPATVLYPSRVNGAQAFAGPPQRVRLDQPRNFVYAGSVYPRYAELLARLAHTLDTLECILTIYSPLSAEEIHRHGLELNNIVHRPVMPTVEMASRLREEADVLVVPMSFHPDDRANIEVAFPSKLADYTATGLPILIWGPPYCSAVRWALETGNVAALVQERSTDALLEAAKRLVRDGGYRFSLGQAALNAGYRLFSYQAVADTFFKALQ